jgi:hypothetical protein
MKEYLSLSMGRKGWSFLMSKAYKMLNMEVVREENVEMLLLFSCTERELEGYHLLLLW